MQPTAPASNHITEIVLLTIFVISIVISIVAWIFSRRGTEGRIQREGRGTGPGVRMGKMNPSQPLLLTEPPHPGNEQGDKTSYHLRAELDKLSPEF